LAGSFNAKTDDNQIRYSDIRHNAVVTVASKVTMYFSLTAVIRPQSLSSLFKSKSKSLKCGLESDFKSHKSLSCRKSQTGAQVTQNVLVLEHRPRPYNGGGLTSYNASPDLVVAILSRSVGFPQWRLFSQLLGGLNPCYCDV